MTPHCSGLINQYAKQPEPSTTATHMEHVRLDASALEPHARRRHPRLSIPEQEQWLASVVRGHVAYYAVPGNVRAVNAFRREVSRCRLRALRRRSQRSRLNWKRMNRLITRWLPPVRIVHPYPEVRFDART